MAAIKFSAERFTNSGKVRVRFALRGNLLAAGIRDKMVAAGFTPAEDISNTYYAWASTPDEVVAIQKAVRPLVDAGLVSQ